jgi:hypothetical protein
MNYVRSQLETFHMYNIKVNKYYTLFIILMDENMLTYTTCERQKYYILGKLNYLLIL